MRAPVNTPLDKNKQEEFAKVQDGVSRMPQYRMCAYRPKPSGLLKPKERQELLLIRSCVHEEVSRDNWGSEERLVIEEIKERFKELYLVDAEGRLLRQSEFQKDRVTGKSLCKTRAEVLRPSLILFYHLCP